MKNISDLVPLIILMTSIIAGIDDYKAQAIPQGTWCRFKGNLNCGDHEILCTGRGLIDCTGNEDDEGFQNTVQLLTDPVMLKIFKMKIKQPSSGGADLIIEKFLNKMLNGNIQEDETGDFFSFFSDKDLPLKMDLEAPITKYPVTEELITVTNSESFSNSPEKHGIPVESGLMDDEELLNFFASDEAGMPSMKEEEKGEALDILEDLFGQDEGTVSIQEPAEPFKRENTATSMSGEDSLLLPSGKHEEINSTTIDDDSIISYSFMDLTSEHNRPSNFDLSFGDENPNSEEKFSDKDKNTDKRNYKAITTHLDNTVSRAKRSINLWPHETHVSRGGEYRKKPINRYRPNQKKYRPYRNKARIFELQRRLDNILDTLKTYEKTHSVKTGQVTTEVALNILASDILHKLQSTSRRPVRDISSALNSRNPIIFGGPNIGSCRVFNMTCWQIPPLSACSGAGIGGCIDKGLFQANRSCFIISSAILVIAVSAMVSLAIALGIYRRSIARRISPKIESRGADLIVTEDNASQS